MAKKLKKRKKLSRRARQATPAATAPKQAAAKPLRPQEPAGITEEIPARPAAPATPAPTSVSFRDTSRHRAPDGIDAQLAATEYPVIKRDLRRLGVTVIGFAIILAGLAVLDSSTNVITELGQNMFRLWQ